MSSKPIKTAFCFSSGGIGGAERSMLRMMAAARRNQLDSHILASRRVNPTLHDASRSIGVAFHDLEPRNHTSYVRLFRRLRPDVAYFFGRRLTLGWMLAARWACVPCLVGAVRSSAARRSDWWVRSVDRRLVDGYIANSQRAARNLTHWIGVAEDRVFVVYNGIEVSPQKAEPVIARETREGPVVVCVANIQPNKGHKVLLGAVGALRSEFPGIRVVVVGRDHTEGGLMRWATAEGLADRMVVAGFQPDVGPYLEAADVFALPSLLREGTPTSILEAMQHGVPVVASRIGGVAEIVRDGDTGLLVEPGHQEGLARALRFVLARGEPTRAMVERARNYVRYEHTLEQMVESHLAAFRALMR